MAGLLLRERLEQPRQVVVVDPDAGIADLEFQRAGAVAIEPEDDLAAVGELDRVLQQVGQCGLQAVFVETNDGFGLRDFQPQLDPLFVGQHAEVVGLVLDKRGQRDRRRIKRQRSGFQPRVVENLLDSGQQAAPGAPERFEIGVLSMVADIGQMLADQIGVSQDDIERRANFMAGIG